MGYGGCVCVMLMKLIVNWVGGNVQSPLRLVLVSLTIGPLLPVSPARPPSPRNPIGP